MDKSKKAVEVYDKIYSLYEKEFSDTSEHINKFLNLVPKNGSILDVGCGIGIDANYIRSKGFKVIGIDLSKNMLKLAKIKFPNIDFRIDDMRNLSFKPNSFDGVFVAYSLHHIPKKDVLRTLRKFYLILKEKGIIYLAVQKGKSQEVFITEPLKKDEKIFVNVFSKEETKMFLKEAGFKIIQEYERKSEGENEFNFNKLFILAKK